MGITQSISPATRTRLLAAKLFRRVVGKTSTLDIAIDAEKSLDSLSMSDRGFAIIMCRETLRHGHKFRRAISPSMSRPWGELDEAVADLLLIGLCQIWVLKTPPHAAVSQTVSAAKANPRTIHAAGFINAILRKAGGAIDEFEALPQTQILPAWLSKNLVDANGKQAVERFAQNLMHPSRIHVRAKSEQARDALIDHGFELLHGLSLASPDGMTDPADLPDFADGEYWVQNAAAALPADLLAAASGDTTLDLCAAPGGKTMQIAARGGQVVAIDFAKARVKRLKQNLHRTHLQSAVDVVQGDVFKWSPLQKFGKILLDAPCTALGTLRRHPESLWIKTPDDVVRNAERQVRMLKRASEFLTPDGTMVYCVCSPLKEEGVDIIDWAVESGLFKRKAFSADELGVFSPCLTPEGDAHILGLDNMPDLDAFFIARLGLAT